MASDRELELAYKLAERKLDRLDREYEMCVNARPSLPPEDEAESSSGWNALHDSENEDDSTHGNPLAVPDSALEDDEVWGSFQSAQDYEKAHGSSSSSSASSFSSSSSSSSSEPDLGNGVASTPSESKVPETRPVAPLSSAQISTIKSTMAGLDLKVPAWAQRIDESEWLGKIIASARAQQAARTSQSTLGSLSSSGAASSSSPSSSASALASVSTESTTATATAETEEFQPDFSTHDWTSSASSSSSS